MALTKVSFSMIQGTVVNVLDYGADPTGSTDSQPAIQAAIDSLSTTSSASATGGGTVYIPAGKFKINSTLKIGYGITLLGNGAGFRAVLKNSSDPFCKWLFLLAMDSFTTSALAKTG